MAALTAIVGATLGAIGAGTSIFGAISGNQANQEALAAQQHAAAIQQQAKAADEERKRRQMIRQGIIQRSQALARETSQGANESSAASGVAGQINQETGWNISGVNQAAHFGTALYGANQELLSARMDQANASTISDIGKGLGSLGGGIVSNLGPINNAYNNYFTSPSTTGGSDSFGKA